MTIDLERRLRRAAELLDTEALARMQAQDETVEVARPANGPRRRWLVAAAAAVLVIAGTVAVVQLAGHDDNPDVESPPTTPVAPDESILKKGWNVLPRSPLSKRIAPLVLPTGNGMFVWGGSAPTESTSDESGALQALTDGALLDLSTGEWSPVASSPFDVGGPYVAPTIGSPSRERDGVPGPSPVGTTVGGKVLVLTETAERTPTVVAALYDPASNTWETLPAPPLDPPVSQGRLSAYEVAGQVVVIQSPTRGPSVVDETRAAVFDAESGDWTEGTAPGATVVSQGGVLAGDQIVVAGGTPGEPYHACASSFYGYSPSTNSWRTIVQSSPGGAPHGALAWTGEAVITASACDDGSRRRPEPAAWSIDPTNGDMNPIPAPPDDVSSLSGWWTGRAAAMIGDNGPMFYSPDGWRWHTAPNQPDLATESFSREWVWSGGALVTWGGMTEGSSFIGFGDDRLRDDGYAYVPPAEFGAGNGDPPAPTSKPSPDPLTAALTELGSSIDSAPDGATTLDGAHFCGVVLLDNVTPEDEIGFSAGRCLLDASISARPAVMVERRMTIEGDPVIVVTRVDEHGRVRQFHDSTQDKFGAGRWARTSCAHLTTRWGDAPEQIHDRSAQFACGPRPRGPGPAPVAGDRAVLDDRMELPLCGYDIALRDRNALARECLRRAVEEGTSGEYAYAAGDDRNYIARWFRTEGASYEVIQYGSVEPGGPAVSVYRCDRFEFVASDDPDTDGVPDFEASNCARR